MLCGAGIFKKSSGGRSIMPGRFWLCLWRLPGRHRPAARSSSPGRLALGIVILGILIMSFAPDTFSERWYVFMVVLLTGFPVGISQKVDSYAYNATVLTGTLRDGTLSLYGDLDPRLRGGDLSKARDL